MAGPARLERALHHLADDIADAQLGLRRRPLRSFLSGLGIGIGVMALVAMLSISEGGRREALAKIESLGVNKLRIENAAAAAASTEGSLVNLSRGLLRTDADVVGSWLGGRGKVGWYRRRDNLVVQAGDRRVATVVIGSNPEWLGIENLRVLWGRPFIRRDSVDFRRYCLLGSELARDLRVAGRTVLDLGGTACQVIGVLRPRGRLLTEGTGLAPIDFDRSIFMPLSAFPFNSPSRPSGLDGMVVALGEAGGGGVLAVAAPIHRLIARRHNGVNDFVLVAPVTLLREAEATHRLFSLITGAIAGLSLLVGGIGVMNVMLANLSEQTREIGLRRAVGATPRRVVNLFLWHSVLLSLWGAGWGLVLGVAVAYAIQAYAGWAVGFSLFSLVLGPAAAVSCGVLFGLHPALRAASLDPAVALRDS